MSESSTGQETGYLAELLKEPAEDANKAPESSPGQPDKAAEQAEGVKPAQSPSADAEAGKPAEGVKAEPKSMLDAVNAALAKDKALEQSPGSKTEKDKPAEGPADAKAKDGQDGDAQLPFHNHPRWKEVIAERNALREKAGSFDTLIGEVAKTGLDVREFNELLGVGALIKQDPAKALERIEAVADQLRGIVGDKLPDTLKKRVDDGEISEADAREISRAKAQASLAEQRRVQDAEGQQQARIQTHLDDCKRAVTAWMDAEAKLDPDWSKKQPLVIREAQELERQYGTPPTVQDAAKLMKAAKARAEEQIRAFVPSRAPVKPAITGGVASTQHAPAPRNIAEAIDRGLAMSRAG
jgi:hypothetical protein